MSLVPKRGDVFHVDLNPIRGREQAGARYVVVISPKTFNELGTPIVCPITQGGSFARFAGFAVSLSGAGTKSAGVVLCSQVRALDLKDRGAKRIETLPDFIVEEILAKVQPIFE
jgi:mRNA-degrading endonuclease toxin of MazEF toxin-antitoxin module